MFLQDFNGCKGSEIVTQNEDGGYTILINEALCQKKRLDAYNHAMRHILDHDFEKTDVQNIETEAHRREAI